MWPSGKMQSRRWIVFQPWNWPRWLLLGMLVAIPLLYFLSAVPVMRMADEHGRPAWMARWLNHFYFPVAIAAERMDFVMEIVEWEAGLMDRIYGPPGITTDRIEDALPAFDRIE